VADRIQRANFGGIVHLNYEALLLLVCSF
jgi:hypothetical protein